MRWQLLAIAALSAFMLGLQPASTSSPGDRPVALIDDRAVYWQDIQPALAELAGGTILLDRVLDQRLERQARAASIAVNDSDLARERMLLTESVLGAISDADQAADVVSGLRRSRGLGDQRFTALLRRNAILRGLVQPEVVVNDGLLRQAFAIRYGPKVAARILIVGSQSDAEAIRKRLLDSAGEKGVSPVAFGELAAARSLDPSGARGGLMEAFSPEDTTIPVAVRNAVKAAAPGALSGVISLEGGHALVLVTGSVPASDVAFDAVRDGLEKSVRLRQERLLMDALARRLIAEPGVTVMDRSLGWSWRAVTEQTRP